MAAEYRIIIMDEFDWRYVNSSRTKTLSSISKAIPDCEIESNLPYVIIVNIKRMHPETAVEKLSFAGIPYDSIYCQKDNEPEILKLKL